MLKRDHPPLPTQRPSWIYLTGPVILAGGIDIEASYEGKVSSYEGQVLAFARSHALASTYEGLALVLVEAMLAGVPIVATRVGGIPYVLDEGRAGRLAPPHSPQDLAREIEVLRRAPAARRSLGEAGRHRAETAFSAERYCRSIDALYGSLVR